MPLENEQGGAAAAGASGNPSGADGAAAAGSAATGGTGAAAGASSSGAAGQAASTTGFSYKEDRSDWMPRHRFNEVNGKKTALEQELATVRGQLQAVTGATPPTADDAKAEQIKDAFFKMFPRFKQIADLSDEQIASLGKVPDVLKSTTDAEVRQWKRHGDAQVTAICGKVAEALGAENLDADQQADLRDTFSAWLRNTIAGELRTGDGNSTTLEKYEAGDPSIIDTFVTRYTKNWVQPARRLNASQTINRNRPVPNSSGRNQVVSGTKRPEKFASLDDRIAYAASVARENGAFGG